MAGNPKDIPVGWIGTGVMGHHMCGHLMEAGYPVAVFSRTQSKTDALVQRGASWCNTPAEVAAQSKVVFTIVGYPHDVREVYFGNQGILDAATAGSILVDMTTSQPSLALEIAEAAREKGIDAIDAPVSGGDIGAREARLSIMIGGRVEAVDFVRPLFDCMGRTVVRQGEAGSGQHCKMVNQTLIASGMIGVCEALLYAYRAGLDIESVLQSVSSGAAGSWSLSNLAPRMVQHDFEPGFFVEHFVKDMGIALEEAARMNLALPGLALVKQFYEALQAQGHARSGTQALVLALAKLNNISW